MQTEIKATVTINGIEYVEKRSLKSDSIIKDGLKYVVIRSYGAGVFLGYIKLQECESGATNVILLESKRVYCWHGAASLSQLAVDGTSKPSECKIPVAIPEHEIKNVIEIIPVSEKAKATFDKVPVWKC